MRRGLSLTSIMLTTFLTLVHLVRQCQHLVLSGLLEKINTSDETLLIKYLLSSMWY